MKTKKLLLIAVFMTTLLTTAFMLIQPTYAYTSVNPDMINEATFYSSGTGTTDFTLEDNTDYAFVITVSSIVSVYSDYDQSINHNQETNSFEFEAMTNGGSSGFYKYESMELDEWSSNGEMVFEFTTGVGETFELTLNSAYAEMDPQYEYIDFIDIQLYRIEDAEPVFSYSEANINTPYYDLITEPEVRTQISANDPEEGDVTSRIQIYDDTYTSADKSVGGDYHIMYSVDDTAGNTSYLQININVIDDKKPYVIYDGDTYVDGDTISWTWYDDEYRGGLVSDYSNYKSNRVFYDEYSFSSGISDDLSENWDTLAQQYNYINGAENPEDEQELAYYFEDAGHYTYTETIDDGNGNTLTINFDVTVLENHNPVISGPNELTIEITDIENIDYLSYFTSTDAEEGNMTITYASGSAFKNDSSDKVIGDTSMTLYVEDECGATSHKTVTVHVVDSTSPDIIVNSSPTTTYSIDVNMSDTSTLTTFIDGLTSMDAWDGDLTSNIVVPTMDVTIPGTNIYNITSTDAAGNVSTLALTVNVVDDIPPVINGATKIVKAVNSTMTLSDILASLTAIDAVDGTLTLELLSDGYSGNSSNIGNYKVKYRATDTAGNVTNHEVDVWVIDNQAPAWILNDYFIEVTLNEVMTRESLVSLLQASGMIGNDIGYTVTFISDEYEGNEEVSGAYQVSMNITYEDGSEEVITVELNVPEALPEDDVIVVDDPDTELTGFQKFWNGVKDFFIGVGEFFNNAWTWIKNAATWTNDNIIQPVIRFFTVVDNPETPGEFNNSHTTTLPDSLETN